MAGFAVISTEQAAVVTSSPKTREFGIAHEDGQDSRLWQAFMHYCAELGHGEIEKLKIQDGVPVMAEIVREKAKFT
jgi:hypothetical protein